MKYRHRTTGEIINVLRHNERGDFAECTDNNGKVYGLQANLFRDYEQVIEDKTINWEQRRYEIAKEILPMIYRIECGDLSIERMAVLAVIYADTLIKELQKKGTNNENDRFSW